VAAIGERIVRVALELLKANPGGIRYSDLKRRVLASDPSFNDNTVHAAVFQLDQVYPDKVYKPSRGLYRLVEFQEAASPTPAAPGAPAGIKLRQR